MHKKILFGLIGAIVATGAFADSKTIPTQGYVDDNFQTKIPAKSGNLNTAITSTDTAGTVGQLPIYDYTYAFYDDTLDYDANAGHYLAGMEAVNTALQYVTDRQRASSPGRHNDSSSINELPVFPKNTGGDKFNRIITTNTLNYTGDWGTNNVIPSLMAVNAGMESKQNKMTCTRWLDTPENPDHTDENCLLWELSN